MARRITRALRRIIGQSRREQPLEGLPPHHREIVLGVRSRRLTYLSERKLASLARTCRAIEDAELPGSFIEAGCALGGSTILIASVKRDERPLSVYDVFGMIPAPTERDTPDVHARYRSIADGKSKGIGGDPYYGYVEDLYRVVQENLEHFGIRPEAHRIRLIKGLLQETLVVDGPVAFAHIDVDWHDPVMTCLERIFPNLVVGGSMILDDYHDWGGCRKAADAYMQRVRGQVEADDSSGALKLTRIRME